MTLKIMTYNTDMRGSDAGNIVSRVNCMAGFVQEEKPDIICLQECGSPAQPLLTEIEIIGGGYRTIIGDRDLVTLISNNIQVLSVDNVKFAFNVRGGAPVFTKGTLIGKGFAILKLIKQDFMRGETFSLVNAHLDPHLKNHGNRLTEFAKIAHFQNISGCSIKIIAGDLNEPDGESLGRPHGYLVDKVNMITHHHGTNLRRKSKNAPLRKDWVMVSGASFVPDSIKTTRIKFESTSGWIEDVSDHSPVTTTII